ncbi:MAG: hypothetical protein V2I67_18690 [Thermoanaerobaculales bacterium]|jgi:hypothetical protein|nr:hypothetical protein [Thermoanaerobaculales bacterium]
MEHTQLTFGQVVETARDRGFELYDSRGLPIGPGLGSLLNEENVPEEPVMIDIRRTPGDQDWGILAYFVVRDQVFCVWGEWSRVDEFEELVIDPKGMPN